MWDNDEKEMVLNDVTVFFTVFLKFVHNLLAIKVKQTLKFDVINIFFLI